MPDDIATYPPDAGATTYLLTVRGAANATTLEEARTVHNSTAGAPQSAAGARALGDLSHNVFAPINKELDGQLLFIDRWNSLSGLGNFFANPQVQEAAGQLFSSRDGIVWSRLDGFGGFVLPVPAGRTTGAVGLIQVSVTSVDDAAKAFTAYAGTTINTARSYGMVSHTTWLRLPNPGEPRDERDHRGRHVDGRGADERVLRPLTRIRSFRSRLRRSAGDLGLAHGPGRVGGVVTA